MIIMWRLEYWLSGKKYTSVFPTKKKAEKKIYSMHSHEWTISKMKLMV